MPKTDEALRAVSEVAERVRGGEGYVRPSEAPGPLDGHPASQAPPGGPGDYPVSPRSDRPPQVQPLQASPIGFSVTLSAARVRAVEEEAKDRAIKRAAWIESCARGVTPPCSEAEFPFKAKIHRQADGTAAVTLEVG